jgi:hypothetical protein
MKFVESYGDIKCNLETIDRYLDHKTDPEYTYALDRIKLGTCFIALETGSVYRFYPSRFVGYKNNTMEKHLNNEEKDGRETNPVISNILGTKLEKNEILNLEYIKFCESLGFVARDKGAFGVERKFWQMR